MCILFITHGAYLYQMAHNVMSWWFCFTYGKHIKNLLWWKVMRYTPCLLLKTMTGGRSCLFYVDLLSSHDYYNHRIHILYYTLVFKRTIWSDFTGSFNGSRRFVLFYEGQFDRTFTSTPLSDRDGLRSVFWKYVYHETLWLAVSEVIRFVIQ